MGPCGRSECHGSTLRPLFPACVCRGTEGLSRYRGRRGPAAGSVPATMAQSGRDLMRVAGAWERGK